MFADACMMPYIHHGDVAQCWLKKDHPEDCKTVNERRASLRRAAIAEIEAAEAKRYGGAV